MNNLPEKQAEWLGFVMEYKQMITDIIKKKLAKSRFKYTEEDVEEIFMNMLITLFGNDYYLLRLYNPEYSIFTWLGVIAKTQCNRLITKKRLNMVSLDRAVLDIVDPSPLPGEEMEYLETIKIMEHDIELLELREKLAIKLFYYDGLSYKDMVKTMGISQSTVANILIKARKNLNKLIKESM